MHYKMILLDIGCLAIINNCHCIRLNIHLFSSCNNITHNVENVLGRVDDL